MRRTWLVYAVLVLLLGLLALVVGFTRVPEAEIFVRAERLPGVGDRVAELRRLYLPAEPLPGDTVPGIEPPDAESADASGSPRGAPPRGASRLRSPSPMRDAEGGPRRPPTAWLSPGEVLRRRPQRGAAAVGEVDAFTGVVVVDRRGRWLRVRYRDLLGWVLPLERAPGEPPLGSEPEPPLPLPSRPPEAERLAAARRLLDGGGRQRAIGPYTVYTDVENEELLAYLGRVAAAVEPAYRARYRQPPVGEAREAMVLFTREEGYRRLQESESRLRDLAAGGHAGRGMVAMWVGGRAHDEVASTLVHELVHMLNRRALGPALPPWLNEGLADDLSSGHIRPGGEIDLSQLGGVVMRSGDRVTYGGAKAAIRILARERERGELPRLRRLVGLDWDGFVRSEQSRLHYPLAAFWVRYLMSGEDGRLAGDFRTFLSRVAAGRPATGEALIDALGRSWDSLEWGFGRWLQETAVREAGYDPEGAVGEAAGRETSVSSSRQTSSPPA